MWAIVEQPVPKVAQADVDRIMHRDYRTDADQANTVLRAYGDKPWHREPERVMLACLKLAGGSLVRLREQIEVAKKDFRDVVAQAEYPRFCSEAFLTKLPPDVTRQIIESDWKQYQDWLTG